jgi:hypothetical protein
MAQEYTVKAWEPWMDRETDELVRDKFGNYKGTVFFDEDPRNVDGTFKVQPLPGDKKFGDLVDYKSSAGNARLKFQRAERPEAGQSFHDRAPSAAKKEWQPRDDDAIRAQWAIGQAVSMHNDDKAVTGAQFIAGGDKSLPAIEATAKQLFAMVERVKGSSDLKATGVAGTNQEKTGYDAFKEQGETIKQKTFNDGSPVFDITDEPVKMDELPY